MNWEKVVLNLPTDNNKKLFYYNDKIVGLREELESLVAKLDNMNNKNFAKKVLFPYEVKFNNAIEEYNDDVISINKTILNRNNINSEKEKRIINLYNGYKFILRNEISINKNNLKKLYAILSNNLLSEKDLNNMGEFYRNGKVFIHGGFLDKEAYECLNHEDVPRYMDCLYKYINDDSNISCMTDYYIKSQIIHFYFVHIHPYFDINGRTSRTTSMWYLLNNKVYPYIIFNRGITLNKSYYYKVIEDTSKYSNLTYFINYMLKTVMMELEKEYLIDSINEQKNLDILDFQTLQYILSMNGLKTVNDFSSIYNNFNEKKNRKQILDSMITPLIDKNVITVLRDTKNHIYGDKNNFVFDINYENLEIDKEKVKHLKLNI